MIKFLDLDQSVPFTKFLSYFNQALDKDQRSIEAMAVSTVSSDGNPNSRYVNCKYIKKDEFIFFSNYDGQKGEDIKNNSSVNILFYWNNINLQIRIKGNASFSDTIFSNKHFNSRSKEKNALAISSKQSKKIKSFEEVARNYNKCLSAIDANTCRPEYWGGFSVKPYYFEFWEGHENRLNHREIFKKEDKGWNTFLLQP